MVIPDITYIILSDKKSSNNVRSLFVIHDFQVWTQLIGNLKLAQYKSMKRVEKWIKRCDMFSNQQFTRYNGQKSYRTLTGGITSLLLYASLMTIFVGLVMETLSYTNITVTSQDINFQLNPSYYELAANRANRFMFAVGITGKNINLASFDVVLQNFGIMSKNHESYNRTIVMRPCNISQWQGINQEITESYQGLNIGSYLCPPPQFVLELQGKPTSEIFKYAMISVAECGTFDPHAECPKNAPSHERIFDLNQKLNFFYINSQLNPKNQDAVSYYIEDVNIFNFDLSSSFTANIHFSEFEITTDRSLLPWSKNQVESGFYTKGEATTQSHILQDNVYARIILRKSSQKLVVQRSFEKITKPISYIGGLSNPIILVLSVLRMYTIYAYEIQFGGKIFKQDTNSSFDSQSFNFITYIKCRIYNILKNCNLCRNWNTIKDYYQCRRQSIKQLDVHLLHKKMLFFEEVCNILLQRHYQAGLHLLPKRSIETSQITRMKYFYQTSIQLQDKPEKSQRKLFIEEQSFIENGKLSERKRQQLRKQFELQQQFLGCFQKLRVDGQAGDYRAEDIIRRVRLSEQYSKLEKLQCLSEQSINNNGTIISEFVETQSQQQNQHNPKSP